MSRITGVRHSNFFGTLQQGCRVLEYKFRDSQESAGTTQCGTNAKKIGRANSTPTLATSNVFYKQLEQKARACIAEMRSVAPELDDITIVVGIFVYARRAFLAIIGRHIDGHSLQISRFERLVLPH
jgi:hypothetical protein